MAYVCKNCHYKLEQATLEVEQRPDCGKHYCIRPATAAESVAYQNRKQEHLRKNTP